MPGVSPLRKHPGKPARQIAGPPARRKPPTCPRHHCGRQEGRFFHGYCDACCYLPLFCFCGDIPLWAQLRTSDQDASTGTVEALEKIVAAIRARFPGAKIVVRADSGFSREPIMAWCEQQQGVSYLIGMASTRWADVTLGTLRLRLLKVAAHVEVSVRRVYVRLCSAFPLQDQTS